MTRIVPLDRHLLGRLIEDERDPMTSELALASPFADRAMYSAGRGLAFAMLDGADVPIGGGLAPLWYGHAEAWLLISKNARPRHLVEAARYCRRFLDLRQRNPEYRRVQCFVRAGLAWSQSFAKAMGFACEGSHEAWDQAGRDYLCFARVMRP